MAAKSRCKTGGYAFNLISMTSEDEKRWERVYTVNEYYDGPCLGVADFLGTPHIYRRTFDEELDDYIDYFYLASIEPAFFQLVLEDWEIWLRWRIAFDKGEARLNPSAPMALPHDVPRYYELRAEIGDRLQVVDLTLRARATFRGNLHIGPAEVVWTVIA